MSNTVLNDPLNQCDDLLGEYNVADSKLLLAALEKNAITFATRIDDRVRDAGSLGGYGMLTKIMVYIHVDDRLKAEEIQKDVLKIN